MKQKVNLKKVATVLLSSVMMTLSSMAFTLETNGNNIAPVHAEEQVEVDAKSTISDDVYTLAGSSAENNVYSFENPTYVSGYIMDGDSEVDCSSFEEFFLRAGSNNMKGTFYIVDDFIELNNPVEIPEGLDVTFAPAEGYSGTIEIFGNGLQDCSFFSIPTGSSLTLLGNFILDGSNDGYGYGNDYVRAFDVKGGTLNLGEKNNLDEYPVIHGFTGAAEFANGDGCGGAIYVNGGTINIYNAQLLDNPGNYDGGAIFATNSTVNFYNGETMNNASGVCMVDSLFNMYGGIIRDVFVLSSSCAKVENGIVESFNLF